MKLTVEVSRTIRPAEYQSKTARVVLETAEYDDAEGIDFDAETNIIFQRAQAAVLSQLGIEFVIDPDGIVREEDPVANVVEMVGGQPVTTIPGAGTATATVSSSVPIASTGPGPVPPPAGAAPGPCPKCGQAEWWDNRADNNRKRAGGFQLGAEWKCKNCRHALWPEDYNTYKHLPREPRG